MVSFEHLLQEIDDFGIYQKVRYLLICLAALLPPIGKLYIFTLYTSTLFTLTHLSLKFQSRIRIRL